MTKFPSGCFFIPELRVSDGKEGERFKDGG